MSASLAPDSSRRLILLVDDHKKERTQIAGELLAAGFAVRAVPSDEALMLLDEVTFGLVFVGHVRSDVVEDLRSWEPGRGPPLILLGTADGTATMIAKRLLAEELTESDEPRSLAEERGLFALEGAKQGMWDWDRLSDTMFCSPVLRDMLDLEEEAEKLKRSCWMDWIHPDDRAHVEEKIQPCVSGQRQAYEAQYRVIIGDGPPLWLEEHGRIVDWAGPTPRRLMAIVADVTHQRKSHQRMIQVQEQDMLTGLHNRNGCMRMLATALAEARRTNRCFAFLRINLQGLAQVNQGLGYAAGDELLCQAAERLRQLIEPSELLFRLGGNEFALLVDQLRTRNIEEELESLDDLAARANAVLELPFTLHGERCHCSGAVGVAMFTGSAHHPKDLIRFSEIALEEAKSRKKSHLVFDVAMLEKVEKRTRLQAEFERGLEKGQFQLLYQPIVDSSGDVIATEALVRWFHPERGMISPFEFIPLAEESGLIEPLGRALRKQAFACLVEWEKSPETRSIQISVNVSSREMRSEGFAEKLLQDLKESGANPQRVKLEVTESLLLEDFDMVRRIMEKLRAVGISFSLDDFGTGYSSLSYLKRLPFDTVKLDRTFVRDIMVDPIDASLSRAIIAMGHGLGLEVVAEGVEERSQVELLSEMGCAKFQGFLFGKPAPAEEIEALAKDRESREKQSVRALCQNSEHPPGQDGSVDFETSIAVVEQDESATRLIRRILTDFEHLAIYSSGSEAMLAFLADPPDLIMVSTGLAEHTGIDLCERIRTDPALEHVPVVLLTGVLDPEVETRAFSLGISDFVSKPLSAARLTVAVRNQLRLRRRPRSEQNHLTGTRLEQEMRSSQEE